MCNFIWEQLERQSMIGLCVLENCTQSSGKNATKDNGFSQNGEAKMHKVVDQKLRDLGVYMT